MSHRSPFVARCSTLPCSSLSKNKATVGTRRYEKEQHGLRAALLKADKAASVARSRARKCLHGNDEWKKLSGDEQRVKELETIEVINFKRDKKKKGLRAEWTGKVSGPNLEEKDVDPEVE